MWLVSAVAIRQLELVNNVEVDRINSWLNHYGILGFTDNVSVRLQHYLDHYQPLSKQTDL